MRKTRELQMLRKPTWKWQLLAGMFALVFVLAMFGEGFSIVSHAQSQGKITASSAKIRQEASTSSQQVGSARQNEIVTITEQVQGADGKVWYKVVVGEVTGYIRSDLMEVEEAQANVEKVNPVSATVSGGQSVRIRANASTTSQILETVSDGLALTVTGQATGSDGKTWYQVNYISDGSQVDGFIRSDFVVLSAELTPYVEEPVPSADPPAQEPEQNGGTDPAPETTKKYDTVYQNDEWFLVDNDTGDGYGIKSLFDSVDQNAQAFQESEKTVKSQKITIIILVFLMVAAVAVIAFLIFKIRDMMDSAYFSEVEAETLRRRSAGAAGGANAAGTAGSQGGRKVMHTVGEDKQAARPAGAPKGQKPAGSPQGARPAGAPQGQRPAGSPQGARPAGAPQGQRPAGSPQGARPAGNPQGQRPAGSPQGQRPAGSPQGQKPDGSSQGQRPAQGGNQKPKNGQPAQGWQSKNFMADDEDEFEFEFLNYDGEEEQ